MSLEFFPRRLNFWLYHGLGLLAIASVDFATSFLAPHLMEFKLWAALVCWPLLFTLVTLCFRWLYNRHSIFHEGVGTLIPLVVVYATVAAFLCATITAAVLLPFYWQQFVSPQQVATGEASFFGVASRLVLSVTLSGQLFITAWCFIYVFVKERWRTKQTEINSLRLQYNLKEAQLASLSHQLNPHFLFNSLNNIRFVLHDNPDHADRMITALSDILRYSLAAAGREQVQVTEEVTITQRYIDIVKLQYGNKLTYSLEIPDNARNSLIPPMSLQLLVENAVKHGIEQIRKGGHISVKFEAKEDCLYVIVKNPLPGAARGSSASTGKGLGNIRHRLHLLYGDKAELTTQRSDAEFSAILQLPLEPV